MQLRKLLPLALLSVVLGYVVPTCTGCSTPWAPTPVPPTPPFDPPPIPPVPPPDPVDPIPDPVVPVVGRVPYEKVIQVLKGMTKTAVQELLKEWGTGNPVQQDDGTFLARWPAVNNAGAARNMDVQWGADGILVADYALIRSE